MDKTQFTFKKVKVKSGGVVEIEFSINDQVGASHFTEDKKVTSTKFIHPDLEALLLQFKPFLSANLGYDQIRTVVNAGSFKATDKQIAAAETAYQLTLDQLQVNGVSVARDGKSLKILGANIKNGQHIALNSTGLRFDTSNGYEEEIEALNESLKDEVYAFLFEDKVANPDLGLD